VVDLVTVECVERLVSENIVDTGEVIWRVVCEQLVSEEHDESTAPSGHVGPFTGVTDLKLTKQAEHVRKNDITVWIDPLDATQEYTGMTHCLLVLGIHVTHLLKCLIGKNL